MKSHKWNKFHLVNFAHNAGTTPPVAGQTDERRTVKEALEWAYKLWSKGEFTKQEVDDMMDHLLKTKQVVFLSVELDEPSLDSAFCQTLFIKLGTVIFEKDIEGVPVTVSSEQLAQKVLKDLDDRRNSGTEGWSQDVRDEAVNTWAAMIDEEVNYQVARWTPAPEPYKDPLVEGFGA